MSYLYQKVCHHIRVLPLLEKSHGGHRKEKQKNTKKMEKKKEKKERKNKKGATLLLFIHTCAHVIAPVIFVVIICAHV